MATQHEMRFAVLALLVIKLTFLFVFALNSRFVMDEFVQLGWAKYLSNGLFDTVWHPKAVGYVLFYKLAHLIGWDASSILFAGRIQTALLACGTLGLIYGCARALDNDRFRSLAIILVLLSFSNFIERIFRTIAEPLSVFFATASLFVLLRGRADDRRTVVVAGLLGGLSFLATQKAIYFNVALGVALLADAAMQRRYREGILRGVWLVLGWVLPAIAYCLLFGGSEPLPIAKYLFLGPVETATTAQQAYTNLRVYVWQTLQLNALLYIFCFAGMGLALSRIYSLSEPKRIALIFTVIITALVFAHNQPWPYVFIMALPFMALWSVAPLDHIAGNKLYLVTASAVLGIAIATSFARNVMYLAVDNGDQLELVGRSEPLVGPNERYFDGIGMLPNRMEPSTLWLDRLYIKRTLQAGKKSEAYRIFANSPPKIILWSYRMDGIEPVVGPLIRNSYVQIAPNLRVAGQRLRQGQPTLFNVPVGGSYAIYDASGRPLRAKVEVDGVALDPPFQLVRGARRISLRAGPAAAFLLPEGRYTGRIEPGGDNDQLFADVYN